MNWIMLAVAAALSLFTHAASAQQLEKAIFAGGCFWCVELDFDKVPGVVATISGYTGGKTENPTYKQVSASGTGHYEAVEITYDPAKVSYETLLTAFWHSVDPTDGGGQFATVASPTDPPSSSRTRSSAAVPRPQGTRCKIRQPASPGHCSDTSVSTDRRPPDQLESGYKLARVTTI